MCRVYTFNIDGRLTVYLKYHNTHCILFQFSLYGSLTPVVKKYISVLVYFLILVLSNSN